MQRGESGKSGSRGTSLEVPAVIQMGGDGSLYEGGDSRGNEVRFRMYFHDRAKRTC